MAADEEGSTGRPVARRAILRGRRVEEIAAGRRASTCSDGIRAHLQPLTLHPEVSIGSGRPERPCRPVEPIAAMRGTPTGLDQANLSVRRGEYPRGTQGVGIDRSMFTRPVQGGSIHSPTVAACRAEPPQSRREERAKGRRESRRSIPGELSFRSSSEGSSRRSGSARRERGGRCVRPWLSSPASRAGSRLVGGADV